MDLKPGLRGATVLLGVLAATTLSWYLAVILRRSEFLKWRDSVAFPVATITVCVGLTGIVFSALARSKATRPWMIRLSLALVVANAALTLTFLVLYLTGEVVVVW